MGDQGTPRKVQRPRVDGELRQQLHNLEGRLSAKQKQVERLQKILTEQHEKLRSGAVESSVFENELARLEWDQEQQRLMDGASQRRLEGSSAADLQQQLERE